MSEAAPRRIRRAARVLLADEQGRLLLFRFATSWGPPFWLPPGGECDPHEDFPEAARRELLEETGIAGHPEALGLVMEYDYTTTEGEPVRALEHYFRHRTAITEIDISGHTPLERETIAQHRWFDPAELSGWHEAIYPEDLVAIAGRAFDAAEHGE